MRIDIACFSEQGRELGMRLAEKLRAADEQVRLDRCGGDLPVRKWAAERFGAADALVFIGAAGIAVRAIAPEVVSKAGDPAVVVVDDRGRFAISLLSGHIGGANELAERIAALLGATPVVTTATDGNGVFAVDVWAGRNGLTITNPERIKVVSAKLLSGEEVKMRSAFPIHGDLPKGLTLSDSGFDVLVDVRNDSRSEVLFLAPPALTLGLGCRRGVPAATLEKAFLAFCEANGFHPLAFARVCSIDLKKGEPGALLFCEKFGLPFVVFDAGTLAEAEGDFAASRFVASVAGVDNVCERSAVVGSGKGGRLVAGKTVSDGVALAAAVGPFALSFRSGDGESV